jgi:uncharacterized damage-inducible protein DinB
MNPLTPEEAIIILNRVGLPALKVEHEITKRVIAAIPSARSDYKPDEVSKTALELAWHIVSAENRFLEAVSSGAFDLSPRPVPDSIRTPEDVNRWYSDAWTANVERLRHVSGDRLMKPIDFRGLFQFPAVTYVQMAVQHSIHHRGQLSMYLRPIGAKVPSIYGESYDARADRERASVGSR